jgi:VIT1/CCC1 family predicted Fe2+/Mn2+ transporter
MGVETVDNTNIPQWTPIGTPLNETQTQTQPSASNVSVPPSSTAPAVPTTQASGSEPPMASNGWQLAGASAPAPATSNAGAAVDPSATSNGESTWTTARTGPNGYGDGTPEAPVNGGVQQWVPANQPGVLPGFASASTASPAVLAPTATAKTEVVRHGGPFSNKAWQWSIATVAAIIGIIVLLEMGFSRLIDRFDSGTPQRLAVICASLFSNDVVIIGVLIIVARTMRMSFRSLGIRRPADVKESIVLGFAAWLIFILLAGVWALVSQSAAEREANNPFLRDKTENAQDSSRSVPGPDSTALSQMPDEGESQTSDNSSASSEDSNETSDESTDESTDESIDQSSAVGNKRTDESTDSKTTDVADNRHVLIKVLNNNPPKALLISILITGCIGAPLLEELLVRGLLFGAFSQRFGKLAGGAISSLLFGFAHIMAYPLKMIPPLVLMGAALAWLAWQTGSIVPGMFIHAFVNSLGLGIAASLGGHILTLMVGSWLALAIILFPWIRNKAQPSGPLAANL